MKMEKISDEKLEEMWLNRDKELHKVVTPKDEWETRSKLTRFDKKAQALRWIEKNKTAYSRELEVDLHLKDGWVVYYISEKRNWGRAIL